MKPSVTTKAPGKIILSGEHAVVYGCPAIVCAIDQYATIECSLNQKDQCVFTILEGNSTHTIHNRDLPLSLKQIKECKTMNLLDRIIALFTQATHRFPNVSARIQSDIPIGCGFGSSAAITLALFKALFICLDLPTDDEALLLLAHQAESLQHGKSSGIDIQASWHGGCWHYDQEKGQPIKIPGSLNFWWYNSGKPNQSTAQCVHHAAKMLMHDPSLLDEAKSTTAQMLRGLKDGDSPAIHEAIQQNQEWLNRIGVVPESIITQIAQWHTQGISAKVSGAGSITGNAGCIVLFGDMPQPNNFTPLSLAQRGCHVVD